MIEIGKLTSMINDFTWPQLPILTQEENFLETIAQHQVVILQGETGSGKTTQIPKLCMKAGLHEHGLIGCTQPRRIAALSICDRLRQETQHPELIGAQIRFHNDCPKEMAIKVMTDGILLQEYQKDPQLQAYSCIIIDEAHERSLNIDILLGILNLIKEQRTDLRIIITSATIDAQNFSQFFDHAPVIVAEGKAYPVEIEYQDPGQVDLHEFVMDTIEDLQTRASDHTLVFLPTEKDINEIQDRLKGRLGPQYEILPLYGRLSPQDQRSIFKISDRIKIVLATNIAETSLTIPGIAYVIDSGLARVSRYHSSTRIQGLPIEGISQASANQRQGRAGRVKPGTCIRLYSKENFESRMEYTEPEILRSNLSNVMLTMMDLNLDLESFPLLNPPKASALRGARIHLFELNAIDTTGPEAKLTRFGHQMLKLPLDVTLAHLLIKAQEFRILGPTLILASGLSIQDPRILPRDPKERTKAESKHASFKKTKSDFISLLQLWNSVWTKLEGKWTLNQLRKYCDENYLSFLKMREWIQLYQQFAKLLKYSSNEFKIDLKALQEDKLHKALLSAFLGTLAKKVPNEKFYRLAGGRESWTFPGSNLFKKNPEWILASEIRETSKVYLAKNCEIKSTWIPEVAGQFCKSSYEGVRWNRQTGFVEALKVVNFKGLRIGNGQRIQYQSINPHACIEILWNEAIVQGHCIRKPHFLNFNLKVIRELEELEIQMRKSGLAPDPVQQLDWYLNKVNAHDLLKEITDFKTLEKTIKKEKLNTYLSFNKEDWLKVRQQEDSWFNEFDQEDVKVKLKELFPKKVRIGKGHHQVKYEFNHESDSDGISIQVDPEELMISPWHQVLFAIPGWHQRLLEFQTQEVAKGLRTILEENQTLILQAWREKMKSSSTSLWLSLGHTLQELEFSRYPHWNAYQFQLSKKKLPHLHLDFLNLQGKKILRLEIQDGPAQWARKKIDFCKNKFQGNTPFIHIDDHLFFGLIPSGKATSRPQVGAGSQKGAYWRHQLELSKNFWNNHAQKNWANSFVDRWGPRIGRDESWLLLGAQMVQGHSKADILNWENQLKIPQELLQIKNKQKVKSLTELAELTQVHDDHHDFGEVSLWMRQVYQANFQEPVGDQDIHWKNFRKSWRKSSKARLELSPQIAPLNEEIRRLLDQLDSSSEWQGPSVLLNLKSELELAELELYFMRRVEPEREASIEISALDALKSKFKAL